MGGKFLFVGKCLEGMAGATEAGRVRDRGTGEVGRVDTETRLRSSRRSVCRVGTIAPYDHLRIWESV